MSAISAVVRFLRHGTDLVPPFAFNRMGFELNQRGFDPGDLPQDGGGRVALVTGANSGIGLATSRELARRNFEVWMLCRDPARGAEARDAVVHECGDRVHLAVVDMASFASIRRFSDDFPRSSVDVLVHNAGVLASEKRVTEDGAELTFAIGVLGPFLLTGLLIERLSRSSDARVIFVASGGLYAARLDLALLNVGSREFDGVRAYANAKRAQAILTHGLAARYREKMPITFASMHPGWVDTATLRTSLPGFHRAMRNLLRTPEQGADTAVWLAASRRPKGTQGHFWFDRRVAAEYPLPWTRESHPTREQFFQLCERLSGLRLGLHTENGS